MPFVSQSRALDPVHLPKRDRPLLTRPRRLATCAAGAGPHNFGVIRGFMRMLKHATQLNMHYGVLRRSDSMHALNLGLRSGRDNWMQRRSNERISTWEPV